MLTSNHMDSTQTTLGAVSDITPATRKHWLIAGELVRVLFSSVPDSSLDPVVTGVTAGSDACTVEVEVRGTETPRNLTTTVFETGGPDIHFESLSHRAEDDVGEYTEVVLLFSGGDPALGFSDESTDETPLDYRVRIRLYAPDVAPLKTELRTVSQLTLPIHR